MAAWVAPVVAGVVSIVGLIIDSSNKNKAAKKSGMPPAVDLAGMSDEEYKAQRLTRNIIILMSTITPTLRQTDFTVANVEVNVENFMRLVLPKLVDEVRKYVPSCTEEGLLNEPYKYLDRVPTMPTNKSLWPEFPLIKPGSGTINPNNPGGIGGGSGGGYTPTPIGGNNSGLGGILGNNMASAGGWVITIGLIGALLYGVYKSKKG